MSLASSKRRLIVVRQGYGAFCEGRAKEAAAGRVKEAFPGVRAAGVLEKSRRGGFRCAVGTRRLPIPPTPWQFLDRCNRPQHHGCGFLARPYDGKSEILQGFHKPLQSVRFYFDGGCHGYPLLRFVGAILECRNHATVYAQAGLLAAAQPALIGALLRYQALPKVYRCCRPTARFCHCVKKGDTVPLPGGLILPLERPFCLFCRWHVVCKDLWRSVITVNQGGTPWQPCP